MTQAEMEPAKVVMHGLLAKLEAKAQLPKEVTEKTEAEEQERLAKAKELELANAEFERTAWLNKFYQKTENHDLPLLADEADLDKLDMKGPDREAFELLKAWQVTDRFGFLAFGPAGCGKSYALQALARRIIFHEKSFSEKRQSLRWFSVASGLDRIRQEMGGDPHLKNACLKADFLFIDDLGAENTSDWGRETVYLILDHRMNFGLTTFITTNLDMNELKTRYHERYVSRIKEVCVPLQLIGKDRRGEKLKSNLQTLKSRLKTETT